MVATMRTRLFRGLLVFVLWTAFASAARAVPLCSTDSNQDGVIDWLNNLACTGPGDNDEGQPTGTLVNGWTVIQKSVDTRIIYVSALGSDTNSGTDINHPVQTVTKGLSKLRNNLPDWLLLRRGDGFSGGLNLNLSGRSPTEPLVVASYAESTAASQARPTLGGTIAINNCSHVAVIHLGVVQAVTPPFGGGNGAQVDSASDVLIEGCRFQGGSQGLVYGGSGTTSQTNVRARRNAIYETNADPFFFHGTSTMLLEGNVLYNPLSTYPNGDCHGMYIARGGNSGVTAVSNLVFLDPALNAGNGIMIRPGGVARGNVVVGAAWSAIPLGACNDGGTGCTGTNGPAIIDGNLVLDTVTQANYALQADPRYVTSPIQITNNMVLRMNGNGGNAAAVGADNSLLSGNIFVDAPLSLSYSGSAILWQNNTLFGTTTAQLVNANVLSNCPNFVGTGNRYYSVGAPANQWFSDPGLVGFSQWKLDTAARGVSPNEVGSSGTSFGFTDLTRSLASYNATLGGTAATKEFFRVAAGQSKYSYDTRYTAAAAIAYIRAGLSTGPADTGGTPVPALSLIYVSLTGAALVMLGLHRMRRRRFRALGSDADRVPRTELHPNSHN